MERDATGARGFRGPRAIAPLAKADLQSLEEKEQTLMGLYVCMYISV